MPASTTYSIPNAEVNIIRNEVIRMCFRTRMTSGARRRRVKGLFKSISREGPVQKLQNAV